MEPNELPKGDSLAALNESMARLNSEEGRSQLAASMEAAAARISAAKANAPPPRLYAADASYVWETDGNDINNLYNIPSEWNRPWKIDDRRVVDDIIACYELPVPAGPSYMRASARRSAASYALEYNVEPSIRDAYRANRKTSKEAARDAEIADELKTLPRIVRLARMADGVEFDRVKKEIIEEEKVSAKAVNADVKKIREHIGFFRKKQGTFGRTVGVGEKSFTGSGFTPMGFNDGTYYFLTDASQEVAALSSRSLTMISELLRLAPLPYWRANFYDGEKLRAAEVANLLMRECEKCGMFDPSMVHGRGIWIDDGRVIAHLGDRLIVDGVESPLTIQSRYRYVRRPALDVDLSSPMSTEDGKSFLALVEMGAWVGGNLAARYMAGQVVCAAICGALNWRPHSWLTGHSQSGKSTMILIIKAALGNMLAHFLKTTSAAGIRQRLKGDALAVLYDEADTEDESLKRIVQGVIDLARISSGDDGGEVAKGTPHGDAISWLMRSCFIMASVNATLIQESDKTRFEAPELNIDRHVKKTSIEFEAARVELLTDGFGARFCARAINMAPTIRANAKMFSAALVPILSKQRSSDMHGAMLAGAFSLESDEVLTLDCAQALVAEYGITNDMPLDASERDEAACWDYILQCRIPVMNTEDRQEMLKIGTLIDIAANSGLSADEYTTDMVDADGFAATSPIKVSESEARIKLRAAGFKVDRDGDGKLFVAVSMKSKDIADMLRSKPQWSDYKSALKRIDGAKVSANSVSFGSKGNKQYAVIIPYAE